MANYPLTLTGLSLAAAKCDNGGKVPVIIAWITWEGDSVPSASGNEWSLSTDDITKIREFWKTAPTACSYALVSNEGWENGDITCGEGVYRFHKTSRNNGKYVYFQFKNGNNYYDICGGYLPYSSVSNSNCCYTPVILFVRKDIGKIISIDQLSLSGMGIGSHRNQPAVPNFQNSIPCFIAPTTDWIGGPTSRQYAWGLSTDFREDLFQIGPADPYADIDGEDEIGNVPGGGTTGVVSIPGMPGLTATSTGIVGLFAPTAAQMQALASYMWTDFGGQGTTTEDILREVVEALKRSISNPLDYVIGLNIIPSQGLSVGESQVIRFGFTSSGVSMPRLSNQYFIVDCGSIDFDPICGDTFLDYAPYSKFSIYLPYIGVKEVDANDFVGHSIGVVYHGDTVTGGVTAYITKDGSVMYQFSGCCALNIPLSADNWGNTISGAVQIATSIVGSAATGGAAGIAQAAAAGAASVAANPSLLSPQVAHSGAISGGAGCMGVQYPFVIREAVRFHSTEGMNNIHGYPAFFLRSLAEVSGYTKVLNVHLSGISATRDELAEIESILREGAIF